MLNPHKEKLQSKGVASVQARVRNLAAMFPRLTHEAFSASLADRFVQLYAGVNAGLIVEREHKTEVTTIFKGATLSWPLIADGCRMTG